MSGLIRKCKECISDTGSLDRELSMSIVRFCVGLVGENAKLKRMTEANRKEINANTGGGVKND